MTELVKYEAARRALAEAIAVDEVKDILDHAEAMRHAARIAGDKTLEIQSAQLRFRAERRLGELIIAQKETVGLAKGGQPYRSTRSKSEQVETDADQEQVSRAPTLAEAGIDRKLSSRAQKMAALPAETFETRLDQHAEEMRAGAGRIAMDLLKVNAEQEQREARRDLAKALSDASVELPAGDRVYPCIYADPPWVRKQGVGPKSYENHYVTMTWPEIIALMRQFRDRLAPDGWFYCWIPRAHLLALVETEIEVTVVATGEVVLAKVMMPLAWAVAQAIGADAYSTCYVWTKTDEEHPNAQGTGKLVFDQDELLLQFRRGRGLPMPAGCEKYGSNHRERADKHSAKPLFYRQMIADMVGCDKQGEPLPVLEMFARFDPEHPAPRNWDLWGNQAAPAADESSDGNGLQQAVDTCDRPAAASPGDGVTQAGQSGSGEGSSPETIAREEAGHAAGPSDAGASISHGEAPAPIPDWDDPRYYILALSPSDYATLYEQHRQRKGSFPAGHVVSMTNPVINGEMKSLGTCECGVLFRMTWGDHKRMDATIECHWQDAELRAEISAPIEPPEALEISEFDALKALSDFCHPRRAEIIAAVAEDYAARGLAILQSGSGEWILRDAGWRRLRELEAEQRASAPPAPVDAHHELDIPLFLRRTEKTGQQRLDLVVRAKPDVIDDHVQTRLPANAIEIEEAIGLRAIEAGADAGDIARHLVGKGWAHATAKSVVLTDEGRAALASFVDVPATPPAIEARA